jgi:hypothetical protein
MENCIDRIPDASTACFLVLELRSLLSKTAFFLDSILVGESVLAAVRPLRKPLKRPWQPLLVLGTVPSRRVYRFGQHRRPEN